MKNILVFTLALAIALSLAACEGKDAPKPSSESKEPPPATFQQTPASTPDTDVSKPEELSSQGGNTSGAEDWAKSIEQFGGLTGLKAPEGSSTESAGDSMSAAFTKDGSFADAEIDAFAQQVWDACMRVSADGIYQSKLVDPATGAQGKGEEFADISATRHSDSFVWDYTNGETMYTVDIYFGDDNITLSLTRN